MCRKMSEIRLLEDGNVGFQRNINGPEDQLGSIQSPLVKAELELLVIRTVRDLIEPTLGPMIRRIVKEQIDSVQEKIINRLTLNSDDEVHHEMRPSDQRILQLCFQNELAKPVYTGTKIKGEQGTCIQVALVDSVTEEIVKSGPGASAEVEIFVLEGDFNGDEARNWTHKEFNQKIARESKRNKSFLTGNTFVNLKEGIGYITKLSFAHKSSWVRKCKLRLGAKVVDNLDGIKVKAAIMEPFTLMDRRSNLYEKHHPPSLSDEVWRLINIARAGSTDKCLTEANIRTVEDFLRQFFLNPQRLRGILGTRMSDKAFEGTVSHARTCNRGHQRYLYYPSSFQPRTGVVFDVVGEIMSLILDGEYIAFDGLPERQRAYAHMVVSAFEHWNDVVPCDETSLFHSPCLPDVLPPSDLPRIEGPSGSNTRTLIDEYDNAGPSTSSQFITSLVIPSDGTPFMIDEFSAPSTSSQCVISPISPSGRAFTNNEPSTLFQHVISPVNPAGRSLFMIGEQNEQGTSSQHTISPINPFGRASMTVGIYDKPSTSSQCIISPASPFGETLARSNEYDGAEPSTSCGIDIHDLLRVDDIPALIWPPSEDEYLSWPSNSSCTQPTNFDAESLACSSSSQQAAAGGFFSVSIESVMDSRAQRRWKMLCGIFIKRIVVPESIHVLKRQKIW